ncbi:DUF2116 family Zn-ribbon domain-containing protein [Aquipseudomonas alcaligenes]|uniref:DUF2116 family Zn-ribbon domain-containing protein n=1 Tax=Aquipseudomonas alcaligenes TaxID=43263 RepID=A0AB73HU73_AQUAC|nr:DUF2116 family Zn-ribbon domain-containing protein [Pseudomonas alcaligenes]MDH0141135.1 DUF2116 family Zn-ribbon domain-containing protein [Pseudomonas alcaligenes]
MTENLSAIDSQIDFTALRERFKLLRDEVSTECKVCGNPTGSALKQTCSAACRQALYRARLKVKQQQTLEAA